VLDGYVKITAPLAQMWATQTDAAVNSKGNDCLYQLVTLDGINLADFVGIRASRRNFYRKDISLIANGGTKIALYCLLIRFCQSGLNEPSRDKFGLEKLVLDALGIEEHSDQDSGLNKFGLGELGLIYSGHGQGAQTGA
jgi:hypothetical protein